MAKLTGKKRKKLPKEDFVFPKQRAFPIPDKAHARNALARCNQADPKRLGKKSKEAVCKTVRQVVARKFPSIEVEK